jgi:hypothetical protein
MRRRLLHVSCAISLLIGIAAAAMWIRSYWQWESIARRQVFRDHDAVAVAVTVYSRSGRIQVEVSDMDAFSLPKLNPGVRWSYRTETIGQWVAFTTIWERLGFMRRVHRSISGSLNYNIVTFPYWLICLLMLPGSVLGVRTFRRHRRFQQAQKLRVCPTCWYDLRASTHRCPECGMPIPMSRQVPFRSAVTPI